MISQEEKAKMLPALTIEDRRAFLRMPIAERRSKLAEQADQMIEHYGLESAPEERAEW